MTKTYITDEYIARGGNAEYNIATPTLKNVEKGDWEKDNYTRFDYHPRDIFIELKKEFPGFLIFIQSGAMFDLRGEDAEYMRDNHGYKTYMNKIENVLMTGCGAPIDYYDKPWEWLQGENQKAEGYIVVGHDSIGRDAPKKSKDGKTLRKLERVYQNKWHDDEQSETSANDLSESSYAFDVIELYSSGMSNSEYGEVVIEVKRTVTARGELTTETRTYSDEVEYAGYNQQYPISEVATEVADLFAKEMAGGEYDVLYQEVHKYITEYTELNWYEHEEDDEDEDGY